MKTKTWLWVETLAYMALIALIYWRQYLGWNGEYLDSDNYFHVLRIMDFFKHPSYFEQPFMYTNYPFGEILHWTRALDLFLALFTLPFLSFYPLKTAAFYGGLLVAPFFGLCTGYALLRGGRLILQAKYRLLAAVLILVQVNVVRVVFFNRPDHHAAFFFLSALMFWQMTAFARFNTVKNLKIAALVAAFSLWMAAEGVFLAIVAILFLFYGYVFLGYAYQHLLDFARLYLFGTLVFWLLNPPYEGLFYIDTGRLSLFYLAAAVALFGILYMARNITSKKRQLSTIAIAGATFIAVLAAVGLLKSPLDGRLFMPFVARIEEMKSGNIYTLAYPVMGILAALLLAVKYRKQGFFCYLFISMLVYGGLTAVSMRFLPYAGMYAALILALWVQDFFSTEMAKFFAALGLVVLEYVSFTIHALSTNMTLPPVLVIPFEHIKALPQGVFATDIFFASDIIWEGGHYVIASPYHRNVEGIMDNHQIFFSTDEQEVAQLIRKHKVSYLFLTEGLSTDIYYQEPLKNCDKLYGQILGCRNVPAWLEEIKTPAGFLYRVNYQKLP